MKRSRSMVVVSVLGTASLLAVGIGVGLVGSEQSADAGEKVTICHFPPGNPANFHTITVGAKAADKHMQNHGDMMGECCSVDDICDDGDACTANFCMGNTCTNEPVDCDDGDLCTVDSCDSNSDPACLNTPVECGTDSACNSDTGACLAIGQCNQWLGSNPIDYAKDQFNNIKASCVEITSLTCDGTRIAVSGSGGDRASANFNLFRPDSPNCTSDSNGGSCSGCAPCPPPPTVCLDTCSGVLGAVSCSSETIPCQAEWDAACAALGGM